MSYHQKLFVNWKRQLAVCKGMKMSDDRKSELFRWLAAVMAVVAAAITAYVFPMGFVIAFFFVGFTVLFKIIIDIFLNL